VSRRTGSVLSSDIRVSGWADGITVRIARKGVESTQRLGRHRWIVEACLSWLNNRRLVRCYERKATISRPSPTSPSFSSATAAGPRSPSEKPPKTSPPRLLHPIDLPKDCAPAREAL
jgi:hypothetical protein